MSSASSNAVLPTRLALSRDAVAPRFEEECAQFFAEVVQVFGIPKSVGQIYGLLYASPRPLGFSDIVEQLGISKGSASQGMQLLRELGAINEVRGEAPRNKQGKPKSKVNGSESIAPTEQGEVDVCRSARALYEPELSLRRLVSGVLRERIAPMARPGVDRLISLKHLAASAPCNAKFYLSRARQLEVWRKRFTTVLPLLAVLLGPKNVTR